MPILASMALVCRVKGLMTSSLGCRAAGPHRLNGALTCTDRAPTRLTTTGQEPNGMKLGKAKKRDYRTFRYLQVNNFPIMTLFRA